jgi:hypothetical protein
MKDKIQKQQKTSYTFQRSEILQGDVRGFLTTYDPFKLPNDRVRDLFGAIHIHFEDVADCIVPTHPELRILMRRAHAIWPWSAFFLDLNEPLGPRVGVNETPLLALALCVADRWCDRTHANRVIKPQLRRFQHYSHEAIDRLSKRAQLPADVVEARHVAVTQQIQPFIDTL